jgi:prepilin-type N-terminal cleavage/methylation domain-containing protein
MRAKSQSGFTLLEMLVATVILAVAVSALLGNLSTSTGNLFKVGEVDRLTHLSKRKMDELLTIQTLPVGQVLSGPLEVDPRTRKEIAGFSAQILPAAPLSFQTPERLQRVVLETWMETGGRRRTLLLESYRTVRGR